MLSIILLISSSNFEGLGFVIIMFMSSANRISFDGSALYSEDHLHWLRRTKDQVSNLEECHVLFCSILKKVVVLEQLLSISTLWNLSLKYNLSSALVLLLNPWNSHLDNSTSWFTETNAFSMPQNIPPTVNLLLSVSNISFISLKEAF